jgi:hypothetical protein
MAEMEIRATVGEASAPHTHLGHKHGRASDSRRKLSLVLILTGNLHGG